MTGAISAVPVGAEGGVIVAIVAAAALAVLWLVTLFLIMIDDISLGSKVLWLVVCTLLAPFAIPVYLVLRRRRTASGAAGRRLGSA